MREQVASKNSVANWNARGPNNVGGRTRALAIDLDFNGRGNQRLLAGGISGGMYPVSYTHLYTAHAGEKSYSGHPFIRQFITQLRASLSGLQVVEIQVLMHCDNKVAWQRTLSGVHEKNLHGIPPSGKKVKWTDLMVSRFEGEMIAEEWTVSELAGALMLKLPRR